MTSRRDNDLQLWKTWNRTQSGNDLRNLLQATEGARQRAIQPWKGTLADSTLHSEALKQSIYAFKTYDPKHKTKLTTHLTTVLQKVSRPVYAEANILRAPEARQTKSHTYQVAVDDLETRLGRAPSPEELSDELSWPVLEVQRYQKEARKVLIGSEPVPVGMEGFCPEEGTNPNDKMHFLLHDMDGADQGIFRATTGYGGAKILSSKQMMKKYNINQGRLSYRKTKIADSIRKNLPGANVDLLDCT